ncbi:uncharacterized protein LAESUDRAFT_155005 [Laetiporus sulphureus 93-53]|uniref:Uncharacterized protein n=1 Tax=Laetiporus sulphureus 93-53 TaxID=1314785 RepID=A0A165HKE6_9APHY|nr:uncharacterized protein LAESUDRAFT_155005 [Laetiporus sulphureus 93-53]KZT11846.1 hypothetical protein LAESUDRAFT_155005 [Laetiporus sulphureus 93-53]
MQRSPTSKLASDLCALAIPLATLRIMWSASNFVLRMASFHPILPRSASEHIDIVVLCEALRTVRYADAFNAKVRARQIDNRCKPDSSRNGWPMVPAGEQRGGASVRTGESGLDSRKIHLGGTHLSETLVNYGCRSLFLDICIRGTPIRASQMIPLAAAESWTGVALLHAAGRCNVARLRAGS